MQDWSQQRGFANPPWCLIHRCLSKVKMQIARVVFITAFWKTQSWFQSCWNSWRYPLILPTLPDLVVMPTQQGFLMKQGVPQLIAWPISGNPTHHKNFLHRLQASFSPPGEIKPTQTMDPPLLNGLAGVTSRVEIPFRDLSDVINFLADILLKATNINLLIPIAHQYPQYMNRWMESV